jgi:hypothetical protein
MSEAADTALILITCELDTFPPICKGLFVSALRFRFGAVWTLSILKLDVELAMLERALPLPALTKEEEEVIVEVVPPTVPPARLPTDDSVELRLKSSLIST